MLGYVYKIASPQTDKVYIGSSCSPINQRFSEHKAGYKRWTNTKTHYVTAYELMKYDDVYISLVEELEFEDKKELRALEAKYIKEMPCVNKSMTALPKAAYFEAYRAAHKEEARAYAKLWRESHPNYSKDYYSRSKCA